MCFPSCTLNLRWYFNFKIKFCLISNWSYPWIALKQLVQIFYETRKPILSSSIDGGVDVKKKNPKNSNVVLGYKSFQF